MPFKAPVAAPHAPTPAAVPHAAPTAPKPGFQLTPHEEAQAQAMKSMSHTQRAQALGLDRDSQNAQFMAHHDVNPNPAAHVPPAPPAAPQRGGVMRRVGKGLGYGALAAGGALAYGLHRQNETDRENYPLVYAPMGGGY